MGVGGALWGLVGYCGIMHGSKRVLLVVSWLEGIGPHSAGIGIMTSPYLGLHLSGLYCLAI